ncbi:MAG: efflux RND transporter periplasmic adaptor subunit, partial [Deltaproteobacteria bacterium]|nr:efflux RND transporter periplasmic adaptor subunit [Deltaproteobacteria bacterium]
APVAGGLVVPAEVHVMPDRVAHVSSVVSGQIASVGATVGDRVVPRQVLAKVRSIELGEARAQADRARAHLQAAQADFKRQQDLQKEGIGAKKKLVAAEAELAKAKAEFSAANRALDVYGRGGRGSEIALRSPIGGQIVKRHASVGEVVNPAQVLFEVTDIERVWVVGRVYQQNAGQVREGATASLTLQAHAGRTWPGTIDYVAPTLDERTRTLDVRMTLDNPKGLLRPGSFGSLTIGADAGPVKKAPFIRADAVQMAGNQLVVFVPGKKKGEYRAVPVSTAEGTGGRTLVISGLSVGDRYVSAGAFVLKSELLRGQIGEGEAH